MSQDEASEFVAYLTQLLVQITQPDNNLIKEASSKLQKIVFPHKLAVPGLIQVVQQNPSEQIRQLAAIEVRKLIPVRWENDVAEPVKNHIRPSLLESTLQESSPLVKHACARVITEIATIDLSEGLWNELPPFLHNAATSSNANDRELAVYVLFTLLESIESTFLKKIPELFALFSQTIVDPESQTVRLNTVLALGKIGEVLDSATDDDNVKSFRQFLPGIINVLKQVIESDDEKAAGQIFEVLQTLLFSDSGLLSKNLGDLAQFMLQLAKETSVDAAYRALAIQLLNNMVRYRKTKVQSLKIGPELTNTALRIASENPGSLEEDEEDDEDPSKLAFQLIGILSVSLPPSQCMNILLTAIPALVSSQNANERSAGLLALGIAVEGAPEFVTTQIKLVLQLVLQGFRDDTLEVRASALLALAQLADELQESISKEHELLLPIVLNMMETPNLKVGKSACTALDAIVESMDKDVIVPYLPSLMTRLIELLNRPAGDVSLKGAIIAAIGSAAHASKDGFIPYYSTTIRSFEPFLALTEGEKELDVKGMAFDSLGAIASSVGKDAFSEFAGPIVNAAYQALQTTHNRLRECAFILFGVLAKVYGPDFAPFLPQIMPEVYKTLQSDESGDFGNDDEDDIDIGDAGDDDIWQNLTVNTSMAMEKEVVAETVGDLVSGTKQAFLPYMEETANLLINCSRHFYEGIRKAAISSLWRALATVYEISNPPKWQAGLPVKVPLASTVTDFAAMVRTATLETFEEEDERSTATVICDNIAETVKLCGPGIVGDDLEGIATQILAVLKKSHRCQILEDDPEEEDLEDAAEYDVMLIDSAFDVVVALAAAFGSDFNSYFRTFSPIIQKFCSSSSEGERKSGVGALAESVNGLKTAITPYTAQLLKSFSHRLSDESGEVRSNATYGFGLLAEYSQSKQDIIAVYPKTLQRLQQLLSIDAENHRAIANICGCVARMLAAHLDSNIPLADVLQALFYNLPLKDGFEENDPIFRLIVKLYQESNPVIQGLTEQVIKILDHVFSNDTPDSPQFEFDESRDSVKQLLKYIAQQSPSAIQSEVLQKIIQQ
ncbi:armadillo-type protein [Lipomyces japonicus]|uniref:armadillo-type protein n=1 Tax=Lipomyces japonicus TaxID=56871 RepID=UPI0034CF18A7